MQIFALEKREGSCKQALKDRRESLSSRHFWYNGWLCPSQGLFSKNYFYAKNKYPIFFLNDRNFFNISTFQFEFIQFPDLSLLFVGNYQTKRNNNCSFQRNLDEKTAQLPSISKLSNFYHLLPSFPATTESSLRIRIISTIARFPTESNV